MSIPDTMSARLGRGLAGLHGAANALCPIRDLEKFDPGLNNPLALHDEMLLPRRVKQGVDLFVARRDLVPAPDFPVIRSHQERLENSAIFFTPGWGNHKAALSLESRAARTAGFGFVFLSVGREGCVTDQDQVLTLGDPKMSLTPEWVQELRTVLYRYVYAIKIHGRDRGARPERNILFGHSKGGLLNYLMACLRQSWRDGRLKEFAEKLVDERGQKILPPEVFSLEALSEIARELDNDLIGAIGSPLFGVPDAVIKQAKRRLGPLGFSAVFERSEEFFSEKYLRDLHKMAGYDPTDVLDFVVTTRRHSSERRGDRLWRGAELLVKAAMSPIAQGPNAAFHFIGAVLDPDSEHDGIGPYDYPRDFKDKHIQISGFTHLDQSGNALLFDLIIEALIQRNIL